MNINKLIAIIKKKIEDEIVVENITIEDKSFLHKNHAGNQKNKFHLKISIKSLELKKMSKIKSNRIIHKLIEEEINKFIHSIQIVLT